MARRISMATRAELLAEVKTRHARLHAAARRHINLFEPLFKLKTKCESMGVIKRYHPPQPPLMRLLSHPATGATEAAIPHLSRRLPRRTYVAHT
jgi:hypothetical protein